MKLYKYLLYGTLISREAEAFTQDRNVEFGHNGLSYSDSLYRNSKRVEILNTGCQLAPEKISDLDFSSLNELHFNATRRLGIDRSFMGRSPRELQDQGKQLEKFQLVDLFRIKQKNILACLPPKAGTTNWQRYFAALIDTSKEPEEFQVPDVFDQLPRVLKENKTLAESLSDVNTYTRMVNTRHPFARLLSGWRQKFEKSFYNIEVYMRRYGRKIARSSPDGVSEAPETHHFSFEQFLNYIVNDSMENYDYHWQSIDYQCLPCDLRYNIIVNQETSSSDADFVTELNQLNGETHLPGQYTDSPLLSSSLVDQFRGLPRSLIEKLYKIYFMDFLLFDYSIDEFINVSDNRL